MAKTTTKNIKNPLQISENPSQISDLKMNLVHLQYETSTELFRSKCAKRTSTNIKSWISEQSNNLPQCHIPRPKYRLFVPGLPGYIARRHHLPFSRAWRYAPGPESTALTQQLIFSPLPVLVAVSMPLPNNRRFP